jgi:hypothetical protein
VNVNVNVNSKDKSKSKSPLPPFFKGGVFRVSPVNRMPHCASPFEEGGLRGICSSPQRFRTSNERFSVARGGQCPPYMAARRRLLPASSARLSRFHA